MGTVVICANCQRMHDSDVPCPECQQEEANRFLVELEPDDFERKKEECSTID